MDKKHVVAGIHCGPRATNPNRANGNRANGSQKTSVARCLRPGPIGRNPYLNFLRDYRKNNCGFSVVETVRRGAAAWNSLSEEKRAQYIVEAFYAPRLRRRRLSTGGTTKLRGARRGRVGKSRSRRISRGAKSPVKSSRRSNLGTSRTQRRVLMRNKSCN